MAGPVGGPDASPSAPVYAGLAVDPALQDEMAAIFAGQGDPFAVSNIGDYDSGIDIPSSGGAIANIFGGDLNSANALLTALIQVTDNKNVDIRNPEDITQLATMLWSNPQVKDLLTGPDQGKSLNPLLNLLLFRKGTGALYQRYLDALGPADPYGTAAHTQALAQFGFTPVSWDIRSIQRQLTDEAYSDEQKRRSQMKLKYGDIYSLYSQYLGITDPTDQQVLDVALHGKDHDTWESYLRGRPSHLKGLNVGDYYDLHQLADPESMKIYGMHTNDDVIQDLYHRGLKAPDEVQFYYQQSPFQPGVGPGQVDPKHFQEVYQAAKPVSEALWNQEPSPEHLQALSAAGRPEQK